QLPDLDAVIVPIGGGGLCAGVAFAIKSLNPNCKVYGVQAAGAPSMRDALVNGEIATLPAVKTIADGIAVKRPGDKTFEIIRQYVDEVVTVTDDEVATAILALIEQQKLITEGAGAVAVAAAMFHKVPIQGKKVVCLLSGGNIDVTILSRVISRGLLKTGRSADITVALTDKPGQLSAVSKIVSDLGGNVVGVFHDRTELDADITGCYLRLVLETRDEAHVCQIREAIEAAGFQLM
ncbi:MAG: pyridoxal-phosphate dependent enzyme, partial [Clostridia bacterium]|nr:pyridoxal-phosphate dependent enzyme [Clostridia bacterium]